AGAPEVGLRAAAIGPARGMRTVPGFRSTIVAQANASGMTHYPRSLRAACPVLAGTIVEASERGAVRLRTGEDVVSVPLISVTVDQLALFGQRRLLVNIVAAMQLG